MADYTRLQLRSFQTSSEDWSGTIGCTLINNNSSTAYFAMEGERYWDGNRFNYKDIFNSASLSNLVNCSVVSGSTNAGFIVNPMATASFDLTSTSTIGKNLLKFSAPNAIVYSLGDTTASGSLLGVGFSFDTTSYLLDNYGGAAAAYSLRRLNSAYTGPAIKVQDNVGGATQDIGFDSNGELDTTALAAYGGSNDVFVETWYDQSGNSNDAEQTTSANRPKIYDGQNGVVEENGKPAVQFDGDNMTNTNSRTITQQTSFFAGLYSQSGGGTRILTISDPTDYYKYVALQHSSSNGIVTLYGRVEYGRVSPDKNNQILLTHHNTGAQITNYKNGTAGTTSTVSVSQSVSGDGLGNAHQEKAYGRYQEVIIYDSNQSAGNRTDIEDNINTFYNIYS